MSEKSQEKDSKSPATRDIVNTLELDAPPGRVWRARAQGAEIAKGYALEARVSPGVGGTIFVSWGEGMGAESPIDVWDPPRRLRHRAGKNRETDVPLSVDGSIEARDGGGTTLGMVHAGFSASARNGDWADEEFDAHERGWRIFMANIAHYLARHADEPCLQTMFMFTSPRTREEVWPALLAKPIATARSRRRRSAAAIASRPRVATSSRVACRSLVAPETSRSLSTSSTARSSMSAWSGRAMRRRTARWFSGSCSPTAAV